MDQYSYFLMLFLYIYNKQDTALNGFKSKFVYYVDMAHTQNKHENHDINESIVKLSILVFELN